VNFKRKIVAADLEGLPVEARQEVRAWLLAPPPGAHFLFQFKRALLALGALQLLVGAVELVAANWTALGRWGRLGLIEVALLLAFAVAYRLGVEAPPSCGEGRGEWRLLTARWMLTLAAGLVGVLLAAIGQTFQTGASSYLLFTAWAALTLPWVVAARFAPLTVGWWVVVNIALQLGMIQSFSFFPRAAVAHDSKFPLSPSAGVACHRSQRRGLRYGPGLLAACAGARGGIVGSLFGL